MALYAINNEITLNIEIKICMYVQSRYKTKILYVMFSVAHFPQNET
jgi:hypothetical protein